ncbi:uncharacterized protein B0I36DRAFT_112980 [Microdochium trichocladiopsis]|uniref:Uncharacterized protein n=1 Tax=Microdochium trichocladiopsis TaxID=1682393 RepID=A0A9P9BQB2_9PEZI|nr:uncharacterized protein B0I36DRAFT_112980 [Microdochium trichocladiopsis]KAH7030695.1 hypothetical protein B0I36DRAFT_112980 [Microdochium trichocladiopsis]
MEPAAARHVGARLLAEIEEESLEELLQTIRTQLRAETAPAVDTNPSSTSRPTTTTTQHGAHQQPILSSQPQIPFPALQALISRHQKATQSAPPPVLSVSGRYLPLIYHLVSVLISTPPSSSPAHQHGPKPKRHCGYTVVIVDAECRFDVTRLVRCKTTTTTTESSTANEHSNDPDAGNDPDATPQNDDGDCYYYPATPSDLRHVYIYRPPHSQVRAAIAAAADFMLYGDHASRDREWWGTIVIGSSGLSGARTAPHSAAPRGGHASAAGVTAPAPATVTVTADVLTGYKGWLRVERAEQAPGFHIGISAEEALADRDRRADAMAKTEGKWRAVSRWGSYAFG